MKKRESVIYSINNQSLSIMKKLTLLAITATLFCLNINAQNSSGYRGFIDAGYTIGMGYFDNIGRVEVNTSHGYQINSLFYVGGGLGMHFFPSYETPNMNIPLDKRESKVDIPVFVNGRCNFLKGRISPFVDVKAGTYVNNGGGMYGNISAGCRIATKGRQAINVLVGYTSEELEFETFDKFVGKYDLSYTRHPRKQTTEGITIKVGYEF